MIVRDPDIGFCTTAYGIDVFKDFFLWFVKYPVDCYPKEIRRTDFRFLSLLEEGGSLRNVASETETKDQMFFIRKIICNIFITITFVYNHDYYFILKNTFLYV